MSKNEKKLKNTQQPQSAGKKPFGKISRGKLEGEKVEPLREGKSVEADEPLSSSLEMFDTLFRHELEKEVAAPKDKNTKNIRAPGKPPVTKGSAARKRAEKEPLKVRRYRAKEKPHEPPKSISSPVSEKHVSSGKKSSKKKAVKSTSRSKLILLVLLIVVLGGASLYYSGLVGQSKPGRKQVVALRKGAGQLKGTTVARSKIPPKPRVATHKVKKASPQKDSGHAKSGTAQEKLQKGVEAPKLPLKSPVVVSAGKVQGSKAKEIPPKKKSGIVPPAKMAGVGEQKRTLVPEKRLSYPYSVYLGSFRNKKYVQKAISAYRKKGLSPYWVKVDLGPKGKWYRVFAGHFRSREEARAFLSDKKIPEAEVRHTAFAVLLGSYASLKQAEKMISRLIALGYDPYTIPAPGEKVSLYVGAFYRKGRAEKLSLDLASRKIKGRVVKR